MDQPEQVRERTRQGVGWRVAQIIGSIVAALLAVFSVFVVWWPFVVNTARYGYPARGIDGQLVALGFFFWAVPLWIAVGIVLGVFGLRRNPGSKIVLVLGAVLTLTGIVTAIVGAR